MAITIKNLSSGVATLLVPDFNFRRELNPGREIPVPREVFDALTYDPGFQTLSKAGYFRISGLEETDAGAVEVPAEESLADPIAIKAMLVGHEITKLRKFLPKASAVAKETVAQIAVEENVTDPTITALIQKHCGFDVINAITMARKAQE